jgi:hypothetical protein
VATLPQIQAPQVVEVPLSLFGGMHTGVAPADLPEGLSPDCQDNAFVPGEGFSRPGLSRLFNAPLVNGVESVYSKTYVQPDGTPLTLVMLSNGQIYVENVSVSPGTASLLASVTAGLSTLSASAFGREYIALSDLLHGQWCPLQYDGVFLDRVTQDGPGAPPTISNLTPAKVSLVSSGPGLTFNIVNIVASDPIQVEQGNPKDIGVGHPIWVTYYQTLTVTTTTSFGGNIVNGSIVTIAGVTPSTLDQNAQVDSVLSTTSFKIPYYSSVNVSGSGGTVTTQNPTLIRSGNTVTATAASPHGLQTGWQVNLACTNTTIGGGISAIQRDNSGVVTVTTVLAHGLVIGSNVCITGVTNPDTSFNTPGVLVASVPSPTTFTFQQGGAGATSTAGTGNVQDVWSGTFFIQSVPSATTFTYQNIGPADQTNVGVSVTVNGQISPGAHNFVLSFLTRQGAITKPSPFTTFYANGAQQALFTNIAIGPQNVVARLISGTGAGGDNYFTIPTTPQIGGQIVGTSFLIPDNTTTSAIIDFSDNTLFAGIAIDQIGNDLFDQRILIAPTGFYAYSSRLFTWGDYNTIQNLLNMGFGGGVDYVQSTNLAGAGVNSASGVAWANPANIGSTGTSNYATVTLGSNFSQTLQATQFDFAVSGQIGASITVNFQYYYTSVNNCFLIVQLIGASGPIGDLQKLQLTGPAGGTSASPLSAQLTFPNPGLLSTDVDLSTFGFEVSAHALGFASSLTVGINAGYIGLNAQTQPLGWSTTGASGGTFAVLPNSDPGIYQVYAMTSAGGAQDCLISQGAYQDIFGTNILLPNTSYQMRTFLFQSGGATTGNVVFDLSSPTVGLLASVQIPATSLRIAGQFFLQDFSAQLPAIIPSDTTLSIYLNGVDSGVTISCSENALIYKDNPYRGNIAEVSYVINPEGIAQTTGILGSADDPSPVMCFSAQRNISLLKSYAGTHSFQDNGQEPDEWQVNNISRSVGACSIRSGDPGQFGTGDAAEDWDVTVNQNGMYLFAGGDFWKISQEIDKGDPNSPVPTWQDINWSAQQTIWVKNDPRTHRIYIGAPMFSATKPNLVWVLDYKELDTSTDLANAPSLRIGISGKMLSTDKTRKWTRWNISANDADILIRPGNEKEMSFAGGARNGQVFGNVYSLDSTKLHDDDYGTFLPYYTTYGFVNHEQEQALGLGTGRKLTRKITSFVTGVGMVQIVSFVNSIHNPLPPTSPRILLQDTDGSNLENQDLEWTVNIRGQRVFHQVFVTPLPGSLDVQMKLQKLVACMLKDPVIAHRSSAI